MNHDDQASPDTNGGPPTPQEEHGNSANTRPVRQLTIEATIQV